ncbi:MAG: hypothetical protein Q7K33_01575 [Candidatus Berkelbacteria bacterium]|nr:hypothetical protein [Candidatus Berkelbacteria bacterium]
MELNTMPGNHELATTNLKILLLVFAVVLVGALCYLVWTQNTVTDTTDYANSNIKSANVDTSTWKVYTNNQQGYQVSRPQSWPIDESDPTVTSIGNAPAEPASGAVFITLNKNKTPTEVFVTTKGNKPDGCTQPSDIKLNQHQGIKFVCTEPFAGSTEVFYVVQSAGYSFALSYIEDSSPTDSLTQTLETIVKSFKILK